MDEKWQNSALWLQPGKVPKRKPGAKTRQKNPSLQAYSPAPLAGCQPFTFSSSALFAR